MVKINGKTKLVGIVGYPVAHTLSPAMHNAAFQAVNLNWAYLPFHVEEDGFEDFIKGASRVENLVGLNVTMPYKEKILPFLAETTPQAEMLGAVNTIHFQDGRIIGHNTDGRGFLFSLKNDGRKDPASKRALVIGAGGAAKSVAISLAASGAKEIFIVNRTKEKAANLADLVTRLFQIPAKGFGMDGDLKEAVEASELIINATPLGMLSDEVPPFFKYVGKKHFLYDLTYSIKEPRLLSEVKAKGGKGMDGSGMLLYQGAAAFEIWTHLDPPVNVMKRALLDNLKLKGD